MAGRERERKGADTRAEDLPEEVEGNIRGAANSLTDDSRKLAKGKFQDVDSKEVQQTGDKKQQKPGPSGKS